jgi:hypothetical protein
VVCDKLHITEIFRPFLQAKTKVHHQKSSAKILARGEVPLEYNHTLSTVWELSLHNLPQDASTLQKLIAFFDPDTIEERFLANPNAGLSDEKMEFLTDEFE